MMIIQDLYESQKVYSVLEIKIIILSLPGLGFSKVQVVDAVEVHVLRVPSKCGLPHAKIQVRCIDALNGDATFTFHSVQYGV